MAHEYEVHGLRLVCEFEIKDLRPASAETPSRLPDVRIELGPVPEHLEHASGAFEGYEVGNGEVLLSIPGVARYLALAGERLVIEPAAGAEPAALRLFLLGSALGALLHQRGMVPLHASAIEYDGGCVAFVGPSGSGKSTTATLLARRGYRMCSDDVMVVTLSPTGEAIAEPSAPVVKLWPASLALSGFEEAAAPFEWQGFEKHRITASASFTSGRLPLRRIYALSWQDPPLSAAEVTENKAFDAILTIMKNVYRPILVEALEREGALMRFATRLWPGVGVFEFRRHKDLAAIEAQIDNLERHFRAQ